MTATASAPVPVPVLELDGLVVEVALSGGPPATVVDGVSLSLAVGDRVGLVGESGSGKTLLGLSVMQLLPPAARIAGGSVAVDGQVVSTMRERRIQRLRGTRVGMVFQDPMSGLDPLRRVGTLLTAAARRGGATGSEARQRAVEALRAVGVPAPEERMSAYSHQLSGGLRQRVMIALALVNSPDVIIADEPTTALDATIQAQLLDLLLEISARCGIVLITHDLGVAAQVCNRIVVLYAGQVMEEGSTRDLLTAPAHPYTRGLLNCRPRLGGGRARLTPIPGAPPQVGTIAAGCVFAPRCAKVQPKCATRPPLAEAGGRKVACWYPETRDAR